MHELSLAGNLIKTALEHTPDGGRLERIYISLGPLSGVCAESLDFCFHEVARKETGNTQDVVLTIKQVPARFLCLGCKKTYETFSVHEFCPACASLEREILSGNQFTIDSIEVEE
jgi:hydrogenase nickel insertion protein HypA